MINNPLRDTADLTECDSVTVTINARILGDLRRNARKSSPLPTALTGEAVTITKSCEPGRYNATLTLNLAQLAALDEELRALQQEFIDIGFTPARVRAGFDQYAVDAALSETWSARRSLLEPLAA